MQRYEGGTDISTVSGLFGVSAVFRVSTAFRVLAAFAGVGRKLKWVCAPCGRRIAYNVNVAPESCILNFLAIQGLCYKIELK